MSVEAERAVGICEYVSATTVPIRGVVKARAADFRVNELRQSGREVVLEAAAGERRERVAGDSDDGGGGNGGYDDGSAAPITRFTLCKERIDTLGAIAVLSRQLEVPSRAFGFAGLKDHRAITTQEVTVRGVAPAAVRASSHSHFEIGACCRVPRPLRLGQHGGNRFRIVLRGASGSVAEVEASLGALRRRGFVNYFGLQRFGESAARNDDVGTRALLTPRPTLTATLGLMLTLSLTQASTFYSASTQRPSMRCSGRAPTMRPPAVRRASEARRRRRGTSGRALTTCARLSS